MKSRIFAASRRLWRDRRGVSAVMLVLMFTSIIGLTSLALDTGIWFTQRREYQTAADAAALRGAYELKNGLAAFAAAGVTEASANGAPAGATTVMSPPAHSSTGLNGNPQAVEAIVSNAAPLLLSALFIPAANAPKTTAHAIAEWVIPGKACGVALSEANTTGVSVEGNASVSLGTCANPTCDLASNATDPNNAISIQGSASFCAKNVYSVGGFHQGGMATLGAGQAPLTGQPPLDDPYTHFQTDDLLQHLPASSACTKVLAAGPNTAGCYKTFSIENGSATLSSGVYYLSDTDLDLKTDGGVTGTNVTIVLTTADGDLGKIGGISLGAQADLDLTAQGEGAVLFPGVAIIQDARGHAAASVNTSATMAVSGLIYSPNSGLTFLGGPSAQSPGCLIVVASTIGFQGNANLDDTNCASNFGLAAPNIKTVILAE